MKKYGQRIMFFVIAVLVICMSIVESLVERTLMAALLLGCVVIIIILDMDDYNKTQS